MSEVHVKVGPGVAVLFTARGTALHVATEHADLKLLELLLAHGADANIVNVARPRSSDGVFSTGPDHVDCARCCFFFLRMLFHMAKWSEDDLFGIWILSSIRSHPCHPRSLP